MHKRNRKCDISRFLTSTKRNIEEEIPPTPKMGNKILCGDCVEGLRNFEDESVDLVVTSPPYFNALKRYQRGTGVHYSIDVGEPLYTIIDCSEELFRVVKDDGFFCLNLGFSYGETGILRPFYIVQRIQRLGWFAIDNIVWHKTNPIPIQGRFTNSIEFIFVLAKDPLVKFPHEIGYIHNFFESSVAKSEGFRSAPFPLELPEFCIEHLSNKWDLVLDPFLGSGTTCVAANNMNRFWCGIDINPDYCKIAQARL